MASDTNMRSNRIKTRTTATDNLFDIDGEVDEQSVVLLGVEKLFYVCMVRLLDDIKSNQLYTQFTNI